jgi:uncharacterized protein (TIGR03118 family)
MPHRTSINDRRATVNRSAWLLGITALFVLEAAAQTNSYTVTNIVDNTQDKFLYNPWGMSRPTSPALRETEWWVSDASTGYSTLYYANQTGAASLAPLVVKIPAAHARGVGSPTGTAYYAGTGPGPGSHNFAFATLDGTISNWNSGDKPAVPRQQCGQCHVQTTTVKVNNSASGASYQGLTYATNATTGQHLYYAANANGGVEAYDTATFAPATLPPGAFTDAAIPSTYAPAGIQAIGNRIYVLYNATAGGGTGYVNAYDTNGTLLMRLQQGWFKEPWGIAMAPANFGLFSRMLLVGNTGSGWIAAYSPLTGQFVDYLRDAAGQPITIPGLWALGFGSGSAQSGPTNVLYFTGGGVDLTTGVFGAIAAN